MPSNIDKDNTEKILGAVKKKASSRLITATLMVERIAKIFCPVKTGTLKRSINHKFIGNEDAQVGSNISYAPYVEFGTVHWSGKPFLRPALHQCLPAIKRLFGVK